jgi:uncharacterized protein
MLALPLMEQQPGARLGSSDKGGDMADNVEIVRSGYDAFASGDIPSFLGNLHEKIEWTEAEGFPYAGTYVGIDAIVENVFMKLGTEWEGYALAIDSVIGQGDLVISVGTYSGKYVATGKSMRARFAHVWEFRDGKVVRMEQIVDSVPVQAALS